MKGLRIILVLLVAMCAAQMRAQLQRSKEFHDRYKLAEVVVFSRHNIRAPLAAPGSFVSQITPHQWHDFGVSASELTMKGGILETAYGQFFHQWVVSEGLFAENAEPGDDELYVLANSKQRTISTARHFASAFMPMKTVAVNHAGRVGDMDANFTLDLGEDLTDDQLAQIKAEYDSIYPPSKIRQVSEALQPAYDLLAEVLDVKKSAAYQSGTFKGFNNHNSTIAFGRGSEPSVTATLSEVCSVADALVLQYYEEPDLQRVAFGRELSREQWQTLANLIHVRDEIRFASPFVQHYVSKHQRDYIADALQREGRKFTFMCGHDTNILNILKALRTKEYVTPDAIESGTPIGSKIVFEKWTDAAGHAYVGVNHVYQTVDQLRNNTLLNLATPPIVIPLHFAGLTPDSDGLYPLDVFVERLRQNPVGGK